MNAGSKGGKKSVANILCKWKSLSRWIATTKQECSKTRSQGLGSRCTEEELEPVDQQVGKQQHLAHPCH